MRMSIVYSEPLVWKASVTTRDPIGYDIYQNVLRVSITLREFPFVKARKPLACRADLLRGFVTRSCRAGTRGEPLRTSAWEARKSLIFARENVQLACAILTSIKYTVTVSANLLQFSNKASSHVVIF